MRKTLISAVSIALAASVPATAALAKARPSPAQVADGLIAADRAFAAAAAAKPASEAVAAMLTDDVVLFAVPVANQARNRAEAIDVLRKTFGPDEGRLSWTPVRAGIAADGTQGFTYGFIDRTVAGKPPVLGKYVAYWTRRPDGWRVAALKIVPRPEGAVSTAVRPPALPAKLVKPGPAAKSARYRAEIDRTERAFSDYAQVSSLGAAFRRYGSKDAMNVGGEADFTYGNDAIAEAQGGDAPSPSPLRWAPDGVIAASSGDLGITYGYLVRNGPTPPGRLARIPWLTVWRRASPKDPWLYVAE
jgi:ketosteroid isomerase-like protein